MAEAVAGAETDGQDDDEFERRYGLNNYDEEDPDEVQDTGRREDELANLTVYGDNEQDPYLDRDAGVDDDEEDKDNFLIRDVDNLLLIGHVETNMSVLEVHVYNHEDLYVHHDIVLPAYPLAFEWLDFDSNLGETRSNYLACGDMTSEISIWNLDIVNQLEPTHKLTGHEDAVLSLSWNKLLRNVLASGSADGSVLLWDLREMKQAAKLASLGDKVSAVAFHPTESDTLLVGNSKGHAIVVDCKSMSKKKWKLPESEIEHVTWSSTLPSYFFAGTDKGQVYCYDVRVDKKPVYTIAAHDDEITGLTFSSSCPGCLVTSSSDKKVKVWDVGSDKATFVSDMPRVKVGKILTLAANPDEPFVFAVGGDAKSDNFKVLDISSLTAVETLFGPRVR